MTYYCTNADVSLRLGLDSAQRVRASTRLTSAIRRATVYIDSIYRDYGRDTPSREIATTTLNGSVACWCYNNYTNKRNRILVATATLTVIVLPGQVKALTILQALPEFQPTMLRVLPLKKASWQRH